MFHRTQQLGIDSCQPRQCLRIQPIVFLAALPDQPHLARMRHDDFVSQPAQQTADPGRMGPGFQRDPAARHGTEHFAQRFRIRAHALLQLDAAGFIQHAVPAVAVSQSGQRSVSVREIFLLGFIATVLTFFIAGRLFICALSTSITWERTASRPETGLLAVSHLIHQSHPLARPCSPLGHARASLARIASACPGSAKV